LRGCGAKLISITPIQGTLEEYFLRKIDELPSREGTSGAQA